MKFSQGVFVWFSIFLNNLILFLLNTHIIILFFYFICKKGTIYLRIANNKPSMTYCAKGFTMKFSKVFALFIVAVLLMIGCSSDGETVEATGVVAAHSEKPAPRATPSDNLGCFDISSLEDYDAVLQDDAGWLYCMNFAGDDGWSNTYAGELRYTVDDVEYSGELSSTFNIDHDMLAIHAIDPFLDNYHMTCVLRFDSVYSEDPWNPTISDILSGSYVYHENPGAWHSPIWALLIHGQIGDHLPLIEADAIKQPDPTSVHPRRAHFEAMKDKK